MLRNVWRSSLLARSRPFERKYSNSAVKAVLDALYSNDPLDVYPMILDLNKDRQPIPCVVMTKFYNSILNNYKNNPIVANLFAELFSISQPESNYLSLNAGRVLSLYVETRNLEMCMAFIKKIKEDYGKNFKLPYHALESVLILAKWHNDSSIALQVAQHMQSLHHRLYARTWGLLAQCLISDKNYQGIRWLHKNVLVPGFLVLDDASLIRIAEVASAYGDLSLCEWVILRLRRRQLATKATFNETISIQLYTYLIEAAAAGASGNATDKTASQTSIKAVCRYIVRLAEIASKISVRDLPQTVHALSANKINEEILHDLFNAIKVDPQVYDAVKTLIFNLLLATRVISTTASFNDTIFIIQSARANNEVQLNEDSILCLLGLAARFNVNRETIDAITKMDASPKVKRLRNQLLCQQTGGDSA